MVDKSSQLIIEALSQAAADPGGARLLSAKAAPGLFPATTIGKQTAERCKELGLLRTVPAEASGKAAHEIGAITEKGLAFLLEEVSPRRVLEDLVRTLEARQSQVSDLVATARQLQGGLEALQETATRVLGHIRNAPGPAPSANGCAPCGSVILAHLLQWHETGGSGDCTLVELFERTRRSDALLTLGQFHDALRHLHEHGQIYLHPWTGPLYEIPQPPCALLVGHEIAYYASLRDVQTNPSDRGQ